MLKLTLRKLFQSDDKNFSQNLGVIRTNFSLITWCIVEGGNIWTTTDITFRKIVTLLHLRKLQIDYILENCNLVLKQKIGNG